MLFCLLNAYSHPDSAVSKCLYMKDVGALLACHVEDNVRKRPFFNKI